MTDLTKLCGAPLDVKAVGESGTIEGYGSIFGNIDAYGEIVMPGAFSSSLVEAKRKGVKIKMLWQHDSFTPIGVWDDLAEDSKGLYVKGRLLVECSEKAREAHGLVKEGALDGLSIGYRLEESTEDPKRPGILMLDKVKLREVSLVTFQANERARIDSIKNMLAAGGVPTVRELEGILRDAGLARRLAEAISAKAAPVLRGEPEAEANADFLTRLRDGLKAG